jgi:Uma2 family endonuclease
MTQTLPELKLFTFDEFIEWYPNDGKRYELHDGVIIEMAPPNGKHESIVGFLTIQIAFQLLQMGLPYRIPKTAFVKPAGNKSAYSPDILVQNHDNIVNEPLWDKESTLCLPESLPLVVEVVSTNWQDDYHKKFADYEIMGIPEYWIVDYAAYGGRKFIGNPKIPTIFVCELIEGEYQMTPFRGTDRIVSPTFPELNLTAQQIFDSVAV